MLQPIAIYGMSSSEVDKTVHLSQQVCSSLRISN